jgi:hypothetical protein
MYLLGLETREMALHGITMDSIPIKVATPSLFHPLGFQNSMRGEAPVLLGAKTSKGTTITTPKI